MGHSKYFGKRVDTLFGPAGVLTAMTDTVTPQREYGSKGGMSVIGWVIAITIGLLFLPILPFALIVIGVLRLFGAGQRPR
ncbi:DUF7535 family protein [Halovenus halobia]|uniref:DUF7535 family protein n=1 Tax=Halovenus halobia TaxID=3396622 RepID=UPI003F570926